VTFYTHGTGGFRLESLGFAGQMAKFGIATVGVDLYMHGMVLPDDLIALFQAAMQRKGLTPVVDALLDNRAVDINYDNVPDPAGTFWSFRAFHVRDSVRQAAFDVVRLVHILRGFDGQRTWSLDADGDGVADLEGLAGDFNNDGTGRRGHALPSVRSSRKRPALLHGTAADRRRRPGQRRPGAGLLHPRRLE
jgi:hypothetical protein